MANDPANPFVGLSQAELLKLAEKMGSGMAVMTIIAGAKGAGKSTLAAHLAIQSQIAGVESVVMADVGARGELAAWWHRRPDAKPSLSSLGGAAHLDETLERLRDLKHKLCVVNTPNNISESVEQVIKASNLIVIAVRPEPEHLRKSVDMAAVAHNMQRKAVFVVSAATIGARMTEAVTVELARLGTVCPVTVHRHRDFIDAMDWGRTVMEIAPRGQSAREIEQLWGYLHEQLKKTVKFPI
jgi:chromosome partitioning protein